jgi:hypothetical protein
LSSPTLFAVPVFCGRFFPPLLPLTSWHRHFPFLFNLFFLYFISSLRAHGHVSRLSLPALFVAPVFCGGFFSASPVHIRDTNNVFLPHSIQGLKSIGYVQIAFAPTYTSYNDDSDSDSDSERRRREQKRAVPGNGKGKGKNAKGDTGGGGYGYVIAITISLLVLAAGFAVPLMR